MHDEMPVPVCQTGIKAWCMWAGVCRVSETGMAGNPNKAEVRCVATLTGVHNTSADALCKSGQNTLAGGDQQDKEPAADMAMHTSVFIVECWSLQFDAIIVLDTRVCWISREPAAASSAAC